MMGWSGTIRDTAEVHGLPFGFQLMSSSKQGLVRARQWEASCDECMSQLWALQFAKETWAREEWHSSTYSVSSVDIGPQHSHLEWLVSEGPTNSGCPPFQIVLSVLESPPQWPCPFWPDAEGNLVNMRGMPQGVWNGARSASPVAQASPSR